MGYRFAHSGQEDDQACEEEKDSDMYECYDEFDGIIGFELVDALGEEKVLWSAYARCTTAQDVVVVSPRLLLNHDSKQRAYDGQAEGYEPECMIGND